MTAMFLSLVVVLIWALTVPATVGVNYEMAAKQGEEIKMQILWAESGQVEAGIDERTELYRSINAYNEDVKKGKNSCKNVWNGIFISDDYLTLEEIPIPNWLMPLSSPD